MTSIVYDRTFQKGLTVSDFVYHLEGRVVGQGLCGAGRVATERVVHRVTCPQCLVALDAMMGQGFKPKKVYGLSQNSGSWRWRKKGDHTFGALFVRGAAVRGWLMAHNLRTVQDVLTADLG